MNNNLFVRVTLLGLSIVFSGLSVVHLTPVAYAQNASSTTATTSSVSTHKSLPEIIARADATITKQIAAFGAPTDFVNGLTTVSKDQKATILYVVNSEIADLTKLKSKIDADTDVATAEADERMITTHFRVYELLIPQVYIEGSLYAVVDAVKIMSSFNPRYEEEINAAKSAGKDVTVAMKAYELYKAKLADANTQAGNALLRVTSLVPDNGNKKVLAFNTATLKSGQAHAKIALADLRSALVYLKKTAAALEGSDKNKGPTSASSTAASVKTMQ